jgi:hypothetical protein
MRSAIRLLSFLCATVTLSAATFTFQIADGDRGQWAEALSSIGLSELKSGAADVIVVPAGSPMRPEYEIRVNHGALLILEGASPVADAYGFKVPTLPDAKPVNVRSVVDERASKLGIVWEEAVPVARFEIPKSATVFAYEKWEKVPLLAGFKQGDGAVLWVATPLGNRGYSRYPYIAQALTDLGLTAPLRAPKLWAFFDSSYRTRVDLEYLAPKWRAAGISALHVAAWHYWERDPQADAYLDKLIQACHRNAIQVYAWVELPHVSERFWNDHPEWREKTAIGQDAQLDWRKLMNLTNRSAFAAVSVGLRELTSRFDWDGVNLAELYFESLEGIDNPARFTPLNRDVRADFQARQGYDPVDVFSPDSARFWAKSPNSLSAFLDYRADLALRQQTEWIAQIEDIRKTKPWLDLTLTHVDDRLDTTMREKIGADTAKTLPLLLSHDFTFLVEDPATTWSLGPQRYPQIAARYVGVNPRPERLAVDINIVERYQDVYPTKQQTGLELFQLVHAASSAFPRVTLYFENSILTPDWNLLGASSAIVDRIEGTVSRRVIDSPRGVGLAWKGAATLDGKPWPAQNADWLWLPPGAHVVEASTKEPALRLLDLNADLLSATATPNGMEFVYRSSARAFAVLDREPGTLEIDGEPVPSTGKLLQLPRGQHIVTLTLDAVKRSGL